MQGRRAAQRVGTPPQARPNIVNMRLWIATSFVNPTVLTVERELEAREAGAELWSICSEVDDYWRTRTVRTYGVITNTTGEFCSEVLIACMMDASEGSVREGLPLYGERRLADALGNKRYSSKIIKAGALLPDTKLLLETWDTDIDVENNLERVREENLLGKSSRSRVEDVLRAFRQRYLQDPEMLGALVTLVKGGMPAESLDRVLYFQAVRSDALLHDLVAEVLANWSTRSDREVRTWEVQNWVDEQVEAGNTERPWSFEVQRRVVQGLLATLRDFGVLEGSVKKRIAYLYLPIDAFAFIALQLVREGRSGERLLNDPEWRLFFLQQGGAERFFLEAHQEGVLEYYAAGRVVRIDFPAKNLEDYAGFLAQR